MKTIFGTLLTILLLNFYVGKGQSLAVNIIGPTCPTCCDASMTIAVVGCWGGVGFYIWPSLTPTSYSIGVRWIFDNVCCGQYSVTTGGGQDNCSPWWYTMVDVVCNTTDLVHRSIDPTPDLIFPNPLTDKCFLKIDGHKTIEVSDLLGNIVRRITSETKEVDLSDLREGMYIFSIYSDNGKLVGRQKVVRN